MTSTQPALLVIDDDPAQCQYYAEALSRFNLKIAHASDGYAGLRKISEQYYDLVLLDISMPKMSGVEMLRAVEQMSQITLPLTVIISSLDQKETMMEALSLGASAYLLKPIDVEALKNLVKQYTGLIEQVQTSLTEGQNGIRTATATASSSTGRVDKANDVFSETHASAPASVRKSQYASLSQAMAGMVFQKITGTLAVETQVGIGRLKYFRGKLQKVEFCGQSGIDALESLQKLPALSITIEP
ncbi:MAG: response regulator transcription factor [Candidatus Thermochlorobacter sp.]